MNQAAGDKFVSVQRVARRFGVSENTVYRLIEEGRIEAHKIGRQYRIPWQSLERFLNASKVS
jgi:excisionase family DNA binding protein